MADVEGVDQVLANLQKWAEERGALAELAMQEVMQALEGWAKSEHRWGNPYSKGYQPTGNLANSTKGEVVEASKEIVRGVLSAGMEYAVFLELAHGGRWTWLWPCIIRHEQDIILIIRTRLGEGSVGASLSKSGSLAADYKQFKGAQRIKRANERNARARANAQGAD